MDDFETWDEADEKYYNSKYVSDGMIDARSLNAVIKKVAIAEARPQRSAAMLEEFAKIAMHELEAADMTSFVLLKHEKLRSWWQDVLEDEARVRAIAEAKEHKRQLIEQALSKLSDEEKVALGIKVRSMDGAAPVNMKSSAILTKLRRGNPI